MSGAIDPKLLKVIELARFGVGGEKAAAQRIVRRHCSNLGLDYDDVMRSTDEREYVLRSGARGQSEFQVVAQVCMHFAVTDAHPELRGSPRSGVLAYTTTPGRHLETVNAAATYLRAFRRERKRFMAELSEAFVHKHRLYSALTRDNEDRQPSNFSAETIARAERMRSMGTGMDDVHVRRQIGSSEADKAA